MNSVIACFFASVHVAEKYASVVVELDPKTLKNSRQTEHDDTGRIS
jgi:hypothetical protein